MSNFVKASLVGIILLLGIAGFSYYRLTKPIHYHAGFLVYIDGQIQDYSLLQFMETGICSIHPNTSDPAEIQRQKAHLHDEVGDVVHVHRKGAVWGDLFSNIGVTFPPGQSVTGYIKGQEVSDILTSPITPDESVIIIVGSLEGVDHSKYVSLEHIEQIGSQSESCAG